MASLKGRMTDSERAETLADLRMLVAEYEYAPRQATLHRRMDMIDSLRRAISELEQIQEENNG